MSKDQNVNIVNNWLISCRDRFQNMADADLDKNGIGAITKAINNFNEKGYFSVGELQYLFNRSHPMGALPNYNTKNNYHKKFGNMLPCPLKEIIDINIIDWRSGSHGVIQPQLAAAIKAETNWEFKLGNLRPQVNTTYSDLFEA